MFLTGQAEVHSLCRRLRKAFPFRKGSSAAGAWFASLLMCNHRLGKMFLSLEIYLLFFFCLAEDEEADTAEAMRKFKKAKQKKNAVSLL